MMQRLGWFCLLFLCAIPSAILSQTDCTRAELAPSKIDELWDGRAISSVAASNSHFCYATSNPEGTGLRLVWGLAEPGQPMAVLGEYESSAGAPVALSCDGFLVSVGFRNDSLDTNGWQLVDFSDPAQPIMRHQVDSSWKINSLCLVENLIGVGLEGHGAVFFDVTDPLAPVELGLISVSWGKAFIAEADNIWYVSCRDYQTTYLRSYGLSDPLEPVMLGETECYHNYTVEWQTRLWGISVRDGVLAAQKYHNSPDDFVGPYYSLDIWDVSEPTAITFAANFPYWHTPNATPHVGDGVIYSPIGHTLRSVVNHDGTWGEAALVTTNNENISTCLAGDRLLGGDGPRLVEFLPTAEEGPPVSVVSFFRAEHTLALQTTDTHVFVSRLIDADYGTSNVVDVVIYDLNDPSAPGSLHNVGGNYVSYDYTDIYELGKFCVNGEYLYKNIWNEAFAQAEVYAYHWPTRTQTSPPIANHFFEDACVSGDKLFLATEVGLEVFDVSDPGLPVFLHRVSEVGPLTALTHDDLYLYTLGAKIDVFLLSASETFASDVRTHLDRRSRAGVIREGLLYLATDYGLEIFDLSTPTTPILVCREQLAGCSDVDVADSIVYMSTGGGGMAVFDAAIPSALSLLGSHQVNGNAIGVESRHDLVYSLAEHELRIFLPQCPTTVAVIPPVALDVAGSRVSGGVEIALYNVTIPSDATLVISRFDADRVRLELARYQSHELDRVESHVDAVPDTGLEMLYTVEVIQNEVVILAQEIRVPSGLDISRSRIDDIAPNPFNPQTQIRFTIAPTDGQRSLRIYDVAGRLVRTFDVRDLSPGLHSVRWQGDDDNGKTVSSGIYLMRLETETTVSTMRGVFIK